MSCESIEKNDEIAGCNQCIHWPVCTRKREIEKVFYRFVTADKMEKVWVSIAEICDEYKKDPDYGGF